MAKFDKAHCAVGHTVLCDLIDNHPHNKANGDEIAQAINTTLGLDGDSREAWTAEDVKCAVRSGAFDKPGKREFGFWPGRYGGYREVDLSATAAAAEAERLREEKVRVRREAKEAKSAKPAKAPVAPVQAPVAEAPAAEATV